MRTRCYRAGGCVRLWKGDQRLQKSVRVLVVAMDAWLSGGKDPSQPEVSDDPPPHSPSSHGGGRPQEAEAFQKSRFHDLRPWPVFAGCRLHPSEVRAGRPGLLNFPWAFHKAGGVAPFPRGAGKLCRLFHGAGLGRVVSGSR